MVKKKKQKPHKYTKGKNSLIKLTKLTKLQLMWSVTAINVYQTFMRTELSVNMLSVKQQNKLYSI